MKQNRNEPPYPKGRTPIRPELLAAKLAAIRNYEYPQLLDQVTANPRLVETMWYLQAMSLRPGGLLKFVDDLLAEFPERIGTPTMLRAGAKSYSLADKLEIYGEIPGTSRFEIATIRDASIEILLDSTPEEIAVMEARDRRALEPVLKEMGPDSFRDICRRAALQALPEYFTAICTEKSAGFSDDSFSGAPKPWYFGDVLGAVAEFMDRSAVKLKQCLAMTDVTKLIFDRLDYALAEKVMVRIEGCSRFGKTESLSAWAEMRPGLARLVRVPCDNSMASFFKRIGEALGIDCSYGSNPSRLKERVEYVIQHGGLFLLLDEAHFLAPMNFTETTSPHRLNWVRTEIVDRHLPLAISVTPQAFKSAIDRFVKKTRYDMTQFWGREFLPCVLPEVLSEADLIAVARIHFPGLSDNALGYIANEARLSQNYLQAVEAISRRTRYLAAKRGGAVKLKDVETAVSEVLARRVSASQGDSEEARVDLQEASTRATRPAAGRRANETLKPVARGVQPAGMDIETESAFGSRALRGDACERGRSPNADLDNRSLRGAVPEMEAADPILAAT